MKQRFFCSSVTALLSELRRFGGDLDGGDNMSLILSDFANRRRQMFCLGELGVVDGAVCNANAEENAWKIHSKRTGRFELSGGAVATK